MICNDELDINFGSVYENFIAQELIAHGFGKDGAIHYYNSKRIGEIDFLVESGGRVLPLEAKSGEDCESHVALTKLMKTLEYDINEAYVLNKFERVREMSGIIYLPIYFLMFVRPVALPDKMIYRV